MAKPSKRKWAREKRERRILAQKKQAAKVAAKLLGKQPQGNAAWVREKNKLGL